MHQESPSKLLLDNLKFSDFKPNLQSFSENFKFKLLQNSQMLDSAILHYYDPLQKKVLNDKFILFPNVLVKNQYQLSRQFLELARCNFKDNKQEMIITLESDEGQMIFIFYKRNFYNTWKRLMKKYTINRQFTHKFQISCQQAPNVFAFSRKKNTSFYTTIIKEKNQTLKEAFYNEVYIFYQMRNFHLPNLVRIFEDNKRYYLVCEYIKSQSLDELLQKGFIFNETQLATLAFQLLAALKVFEDNEIYHGNLNPHTVLMSLNSQMISIYLLNFQLSKEFPISELFSFFNSPNILKGGDRSIQTDLYSVGALLYYITFFRLGVKINALVEMDYNEQRKKQYQMLYCHSQLDFIQQLIFNKNIQIQQAIKHHWLINMKQKVKANNHHYTMLPSLDTIVEQNEQSQIQIRDMSLSRKVSVKQKSWFQLRQSSVSVQELQGEYEVEAENANVTEIYQQYQIQFSQMKPSKISHENQLKDYYNLDFKHQVLLQELN